jgi:ribose 5-phosphate isomerase A
LKGSGKLKPKAESKEPSAWLEKAKKNAALHAVEHVKDGYVIGLGSGSTAAYAIKEIGKLIHKNKWHILGVPTSHQAFELAMKNRIPITTLDEHPRLNLTIDGADQIDPDLNLIKGMGGALTREKLVASASKQNIIIADETKLTKKLGTNQPVPIEVLPMALTLIQTRIKQLKGKPILRECGGGKLGPVVTDNGNFILDVDFGTIPRPDELNKMLKLLPGVVETGLFIDTADIVYVGTPSHIHRFTRKK